MKISVVTPTFDRRLLVTRSINSSLDYFSKDFLPNNFEIVVIDDCSNDGSYEYIYDKYKQDIITGKLKLIHLSDNIGVTGAKNKGAQEASGEWLVFMDSDDYFDLGSRAKFIEELKAHKDYDILLFRCKNQDGLLIGLPRSPNKIDIKELLNQGTPGECLPVIKKHVINKIPYKSFLRGGEALTYLEMLNQGYKAYISDLVVRIYDDSSEDRLCTKNQLQKRAKQLVQFNLLKLKFIKHMTTKTFTKTITRIFFYTFAYLKNKLQ